MFENGNNIIDNDEFLGDELILIIVEFMGLKKLRRKRLQVLLKK